MNKITEDILSANFEKSNCEFKINGQIFYVYELTNSLYIEKSIYEDGYSIVYHYVCGESNEEQEIHVIKTIEQLDMLNQVLNNRKLTRLRDL